VSDKFFKRFIIIVAILGTLLLIFHTIFFNYHLLNFYEDNTIYLDEVVKITGKVKDITLKENILFFKVCQYSRCLDSVYFNISKSKQDLFYDMQNSKLSYEFIGKYTLYNNKPEFIVYKLL
jgi:hypothetical protein